MNWSFRDGALLRTIPLDTYTDGIVLIARIVVQAELVNHHPDIEYTYRTLRIKLMTHDAGGVTELDTGCAKKIDAAL